MTTESHPASCLASQKRPILCRPVCSWQKGSHLQPNGNRREVEIGWLRLAEPDWLDPRKSLAVQSSGSAIGQGSCIALSPWQHALGTLPLNAEGQTDTRWSHTKWDPNRVRLTGVADKGTKSRLQQCCFTNRERGNHWANYVPLLRTKRDGRYPFHIISSICSSSSNNPVKLSFIIISFPYLLVTVSFKG